jgi:hypothetical protein
MIHVVLTAGPTQLQAEGSSFLQGGWGVGGA